MSSFGIFESASLDGRDQELEKESRARRFLNAEFEAQERFGSYLAASSSPKDYRDRLSLIQKDLHKVVSQFLTPSKRVMNRIHRSLEKSYPKMAAKTSATSSWTFDEEKGAFVVEGDTQKFACTECGVEHPSGFNRCSCGKVWNITKIQAGEQVRMFAREVEDRKTVVASRRGRSRTSKRWDDRSWAFQEWFTRTYPYEDYDDYDDESKEDFAEEFKNRNSRRTAVARAVTIPAEVSSHPDFQEAVEWMKTEFGTLSISQDESDEGLRMAEGLAQTLGYGIWEMADMLEQAVWGNVEERLGGVGASSQKTAYFDDYLDWVGIVGMDPYSEDTVDDYIEYRGLDPEDAEELHREVGFMFTMARKSDAEFIRGWESALRHKSSEEGADYSSYSDEVLLATWEVLSEVDPTSPVFRDLGPEIIRRGLQDRVSSAFQKGYIASLQGERR